MMMDVVRDEDLDLGTRRASEVVAWPSVTESDVKGRNEIGPEF